MISTSAFSAAALLAELLDWVRVESPTYDAASVNRMLDLMAPRIGALGFTVERLAGRDGLGDILRCRLNHCGDDGGILMIAHADTVHPVGTLAGQLPIRREGDKCYGPAIYDMKGGTVMALAALRAAIDAKAVKLPVTLIVNPDEEIGSPTSRELIEAEAKRHRYVLIPEPAKGPRGEVTTGRHAFQRFFLTTHGRPAHSGWTNRDGRSAVRVMAQLIEELESRSDLDNGPTYAVSVVHGGRWVNCVPVTCSAQALCVSRDNATFAEIGRVMDGLVGVRSDVRIEGSAALCARCGPPTPAPWPFTSAPGASPASLASICRTPSMAAAPTATSPAPSASPPWTAWASWAAAPIRTRSTSWSPRWCRAPHCWPG